MPANAQADTQGARHGLAMHWQIQGTIIGPMLAEYAIAIAMTLLGLQKLKDIESFSTMS